MNSDEVDQNKDHQNQDVDDIDGDEDLDDLLEGCTQDLDKKLTISDQPSATMNLKPEEKESINTNAQQTPIQQNAPKQEQPNINKEDPFGLNDPEFKDTLKEILQDDGQAQEAMQGLQQMMNMVTGMMNQTQSSSNNASSQEDIEAAQKLFEQMSKAASMGDQMEQQQKQSPSDSNDPQKQSQVTDEDMKKQEEQAMTLLQQMLSGAMTDMKEDGQQNNPSQAKEEVKETKKEEQIKEPAKQPEQQNNPSANPFDSAAQSLFKNLNQVSEEQQKTKPNDVLPEMDEDEAKKFEQNFMSMFEGLAKSLDDNDPSQQDQNNMPKAPNMSQEQEDEAAQQAEELMKNMFSMFGSPDFMNGGNNSQQQQQPNQNQGQNSQQQSNDPFAALMNQLNGQFM